VTHGIAEAADVARWLADLCTAPHALQRLEELDLSALSLDASLRRCLLHLPALTRFVAL
jgi:hypothetical protein